MIKKIFLPSHSKFIGVIYYKYNITLIALFMNWLAFQSRK